MFRMPRGMRLPNGVLIRPCGACILSAQLCRACSHATATSTPVLQARELSRLVKEVVMLERLITGSSTDNVAVSGDFKLSRLSIDEIETLRALEAKAAL